jgi:hypothetical protein
MVGVWIIDALHYYYYYYDRITGRKLCGHVGHKRSGYSVLVGNCEGELPSTNMRLKYCSETSIIGMSACGLNYVAEGREQ